jgi:hypothetical protein
MALTASVVRVSSRAALVLVSAAFALGSIGMSERVALASQDSSPGQPAFDSRKIEGTWRVQVTLVSCQTGTPVAAPFPALATFGRGGTVVTSDGGMSPTSRGAGLGIWSFVGPGAYEVFTEAFLFTNGVRSGTQQIRQEIQIGSGGYEFMSSISSRVLGVDGNTLFVGCANSVGQRME